MSSERDDLWPYFAVDVPGMSKADAERTLAWLAEEAIGVGGWIVDPRELHAVYEDAWTVRLHVKLASIALRSGELSPEEADGAKVLMQNLTEWLTDIAVEEADFPDTNG